MRQNDLFGGVDAYGMQLPPESMQELKRQAIERVAANAPDGWIDQAVNAIRHVTLTRRFITSDDIWPLVTAPPEPRALGAAFQEASRRGIIRKTDRVIASARPACHGRPIAVWEVAR